MAIADPRELLRLATETAREAGALAVRGQRRVRVSDTKSTPTDVVTEMDHASERLVRQRLLEARPGDALLGEEDGSSRGASGVRWIVDPIDGTVNYLYGRRDWAVSIAAEVEGEILAGVVHAPARAETYTALNGEGAWRDGVALAVHGAPDLELALVATGFGYDARQRARQGEIVRHVLPRVRDIRRAGSAALDLCAVASGEVDAYYEQGLNIWDWGAAALIAREAGVRVSGPNGRPPDSLLVVAAHPDVFQRLHDLVAPLHAADGV